MEIIAELETAARDAYTGSVGYLCNNGDMDLNILIRTITHQCHQYTFRAGAGIVADSDPIRELNETRSKAMGMQSIFTSNQLSK
jgi:anthranilate synthase component 1